MRCCWFELKGNGKTTEWWMCGCLADQAIYGNTLWKRVMVIWCCEGLSRVAEDCAKTENGMRSEVDGDKLGDFATFEFASRILFFFW